MKPFVHKRIVTIGDTDMFGVVYYLNYLKWCAEAREVFAFRYVEGFPGKHLISVVDMSADFFTPAKLKDEISIKIHLDFTDRKATHNMYFDLRRSSDGRRIATHRQTLVFTSLNGKIIKLPKQAVELIERCRPKG
jgi:YbgC/YbaW family acyl-CoA thioester hydrolase